MWNIGICGFLALPPYNMGGRASQGVAFCPASSLGHHMIGMLLTSERRRRLGYIVNEINQVTNILYMIRCMVYMQQVCPMQCHTCIIYTILCLFSIIECIGLS